MNNISVVGDVWMVLDEYNTSVPLEYYFVVDHIDEEGYYVELENGYRLWDDAIKNEWVKRIR